MNYYEVFGLEPLLNLDLDALEKKFHELSRRFHPDFHGNQPREERDRALEATALLNAAYRTLRDPTRRAEYLVRSNGCTIDGSKVPQAMLAEIFEINEGLEAVRAARRAEVDPREAVADFERFEGEIEAMRRRYQKGLREAFLEWDRLVAAGASAEERRQHLDRLADALSEAAYIRNLEKEIEDEVSQ